MQKIHPFLWFNDQAEQAMEFYLSVFKNSKRGDLVRYGEAGPGPKGTVMIANFEIEGMEVTALNGGPLFQFNESVSLVVRCDSQAEIDYYWEKLTAEGGMPGSCGWLKDKYGLSWQVVSIELIEMLSGGAAERSQRAMAVMMKMHKLDIAKLKAAYAG